MICFLRKKYFLPALATDATVVVLGFDDVFALWTGPRVGFV
jgi:hypothetical protein